MAFQPTVNVRHQALPVVCLRSLILCMYEELTKECQYKKLELKVWKSDTCDTAFQCAANKITVYFCIICEFHSSLYQRSGQSLIDHEAIIENFRACMFNK